MATATISKRAGSTLTLLCVKRDADGVEEDLATVSVEAYFNESSSNKFVANGTVTKTGGGTFSIGLSAAQTAGIGQKGLSCTIKYTYASGAVDILDPFTVDIKR